MNEWYPEHHIALSSDHIIGAAVLCPAWPSEDDVWRITIAQDGNAVQEISIRHPDNSVEVLERKRRLSKVELQDLLDLITDIEFETLDSEHDGDWSSDDSTTIAVRMKTDLKQVYAYGAHYAASEGSEEMQRYVRLWDRIVELSPINTEAWKTEVAGRQNAAEVYWLKKRTTETDFQLPTVARILGLLFGVPIFTLLLQVLYPKFGRPLPELPTWHEFATFAIINYIVAIGAWTCVGVQRRRERLLAAKQLKHITPESSGHGEGETVTK